MKYECKDKIVLVTGASSGIGAEIAKAFAARGAAVALNGRNKDALNSVKEDILKSGGKASVFPFDLTDLDNVPELVRTIEDSLGDSISILVNSAGIAVLGFVEDVPIDEYRHNLEINFFAALALTKAVIPQMKEKRSGQIINISSGVSKRGLPGASSYCVSKFALNALTESLRIELLPYGINVISVSPGLVKTKFADRIKVFGKIKEKFTEGRMLSAEEVAKKIMAVSENPRREVVLSLRTKLSYHLNYWAPKLFDHILEKRMGRVKQ
jgi:hypothetical protein